jgi:hypothetical protein
LRDLRERRVAVESWVIADGHIIGFHSQWKYSERQLSQLDGSIEPLLQFRLYLAAILVNVNNVRKYQQGANHDGNQNNYDDDDLSHESSLSRGDCASMLLLEACLP